ncbi:histamine H2 receptor-like [Orbicella faveolata]|uniref:histamine H2 receptor-like n=1 Tax=Orbicella faveolata TaxID=48498 RepID=UPI0009E4DCEB|nr:histamine H2 receptor-like [Orbicella faveolata]
MDQGLYETSQEITCTSSLHGNHYMYSLTALNVMLAITASLGNALILVALRKDSTLHPPSKLMFRCLTVTDLCVGLISQPFYVIQLMSIIHKQEKLCYAMVSINAFTSQFFCGVSLYTLTAISVDRLVALRLGLRYTQVWRVITLRRTRGIMIIIWILNISMLCLKRFWMPDLMSQVITALIYTPLALAAFSYFKIYVTLRRHRIQLRAVAQQGKPNRGGMSPLNIKRYRKTVSTGLCVQLVLVACYLPYAIVVAVAHARGYSPAHNLAVRITITLVLLNSSLNPILYCWNIRGVRKAVKDTIKQWFSW